MLRADQKPSPNYDYKYRLAQTNQQDTKSRTPFSNQHSGYIENIYKDQKVPIKISGDKR